MTKHEPCGFCGLVILSLFPGIDMLGKGFEEQCPYLCLVRGPDLLWGGDVRRFHPPAGKFDGVIGGPPCQFASRLAFLNPLAGKRHGNLIPEFERCVAEARPRWFVMENVKAAPVPIVAGYVVKETMLNNRWLGAEQNRLRRFSFGSRDGLDLAHHLEMSVFEAPLYAHAVTSNANPVPVAIGGNGKRKRTARPPTVLAGHGPVGRGGEQWETNLTIAEMCKLQGLPTDFLQAPEVPFTMHGKRSVIGNGVPLPMGRAIAKAILRSTSGES